MRDYGKVHTSFWTSETIRSMSEDARTLAMYLLTCPHNTIVGVFRLPDGYVCDDMQWTVDRVLKAFRETDLKGFANRCETTKWVWINKHIEWNPPENPNQRKSAAKIALSVPDQCAWKQAFMLDCVESIGIVIEQLPNPSATLSQPETETGTVTEDKTHSATDVAGDSGEDSGSGIYSQAFLTFWNLYPNRVNKGAAFKAFKKIRAAEYPAIREGLERKKQSQAWLKDNGQFIPHAATWLNARGWEDEDARPACDKPFDMQEFLRRTGAMET